MKRPELQMVNGELAGRRFAVTEAGLRLGRSSSNDIHVPDEALSRNHCLFETEGDAGIRVTDLASANGTSVNGRIIGGEAVSLRPGDLIEAGGVQLRVVGDEPPPAAGVDLGLGTAQGGAAPAGAPAKRRPPLVNTLWALAVVIALVAIWTLVRGRPDAGGGQPIGPVEEEKETLVELQYEKVDANSDTVFRYAMSLLPGGTLKVELDDVPVEDRHIAKSLKLGDSALKRLEEIVSDSDFQSLDREYQGPETDPPTLRSRRLRVVWSGHSRTVLCVNTVEPDAFTRLREKLEAFSKNELGIWAMGQSRAQLVEHARLSAETAKVKWEDRDTDYGNCFAAVRAYREAIFYLDTVNPKPPEYDGYQAALAAAEKDLDERCRNQSFAADRAINLADWQTAREALAVLCEIVPDRDDDRYRAASAKLVDVEERIRKGGK